MKNIIFALCLSFLIFSISCEEKRKETTTKDAKEVVISLPFTTIDFKDMTAFKEVSDNWKIVGGVNADRNQNNNLQVEEGTGFLTNIPKEDNKGNLFTLFEHGDIEIELDVMMPKGSNSGLYFQSRYEVQLFDSWGVKEPTHGDMGGIYQRWDTTKEEGKEGFQGIAPITNAAKAPGLWQHLRIVFHAPKFDAAGIKIKNAWFEEVKLNGVLIHKNVELTGPTRGGIETIEVSKAPLMIQGDHGSIAFKNMKYKLYSDMSIGFKNLKLAEYENNEKIIPNLDSLTVVQEEIIEKFELDKISNTNDQRIFKYTGVMDIPVSGDYLFDIKVDGGAALLMNKDTLVNLNGDYNRDSLGLGKIKLEKGDMPFTLIYNKHTPWRRHLKIFIEGPDIQKYSLQEGVQKENGKSLAPNFFIKVDKEPIAQRSFWMHDGEKRTHCISVGMPQESNYSYDLETGSLLQVWGGDFMDATKMWLSRGEKQLGEPMGGVVSFHGDAEFALLENEESAWPNEANKNSEFKQQGYEFDSKGIPTFLNEIDGSVVTNKIIPSDEERSLKRVITVDAKTKLWYKVAEGEQIDKLLDGTFIINNESYFIDFDESSPLKPFVRNSNDKDELLVKIPEGKQNFNYNIIW